MTDLEKFLRQASKGLWGAQRQTVRRELESHVRHRANRYEVSGSSEIEAIKLAIADLGEARAISAGMRQTYTVPTTIRGGMLLAGMAMLGFMGTQLSIAQIGVDNRYPTPECIEQHKTTFSIGTDQLPCDQMHSISLANLRTILEPLGVVFEVNANTPRTTTLRFPEGNAANLYEFEDQNWKDSKGNPATISVLPGRTLLYEFFSQLRATALPVRIQGWNNPRITVGKTSFTVGTNEQPLSADVLYSSLLYSRSDTELPGGNAEPLLFGTGDCNCILPAEITPVQPKVQFEHRIQTKLKAGEVVIVFSRESQITVSGVNPMTKKTVTQTIPISRRAYVAQVDANGQIAYPSFSRTLAAVKLEQVKRGVANGHATIALARFTGEYGYKTNPLEPVAPETIKIESAK